MLMFGSAALVQPLNYIAEEVRELVKDVRIQIRNSWEAHTFTWLLRTNKKREFYKKAMPVNLELFSLKEKNACGMPHSKQQV